MVICRKSSKEKLRVVVLERSAVESLTAEGSGSANVPGCEFVAYLVNY